MRDTIKILGVEIDNITRDEAGTITKKLINESNKSCKLIVAPNVEFIMTANIDKEFFEILNSAELATPDSVGVMLGAKLQGKKFKERIPRSIVF
jgi:N-acetylglucosaminyldiphosphoundecaprenol N-acetyl-beta-D-mannosaminyltransferase